MALEDLSLFRSIPHSVVFYPLDAVATEHAMVHSTKINATVYIRLNRPDLPVIYDNHETFEIGVPHVVNQHADSKVTIVSAGVTLYEALHAAETLAKEGIHVDVIDLFTIKPIHP